MKRIWLESYPPGVPHDIDTHAYASLNDLLEKSCDRFSARVAFSGLGGTLTYAEVERLSRQFGAFLQQGLSLARGARIAIMLPNVLQYPIAIFGALRAGLVVVNVNPLYTADEVAHQLADAGAAAIVVLENFAHTVEQVLGKTAMRHVIVTSVGDLLPFPRRWFLNAAVKYLKRAVPRWSIRGALRLRHVLAAGHARVVDEIAATSDDTAFLQYTGGTTGRAKGAVLTHGNMIANVEQVTAWVSPPLEPGKETVITALPLYHVFALTANLLVFVKLGGRNVLVPNARDLRSLVQTLAKTRFTCITGVNTLFKALLDAPGFGKVAAVSRGVLKSAVSGGMSVEPNVAERWQQATGVPLVEGYGLTEASPVVCANRLDTAAFTAKLGLPLPSTEVRVAAEDGTELPIGEAGEICVRGPQVMRCYWNASRETALAFTADGWLRTGDIGRMDAQGYVEFLERKKDVIVVSGFKAYPTEIEAVAMRHPGVKDAAAIGIPDDHTGEAVALFVVRKDPALTVSAISDHCSRHLTGYKRPKTIEFREQLPKTVIGKTLRRALRVRAAEPAGGTPQPRPAALNQGNTSGTGVR